jgi:branched-chain amino acid aminotransferase
MIQKLDKIWFNGYFIDWDKANTHILAHSLHYGTSVFEGIRCYNVDGVPKIFKLKEHIKRFFDSAKSLKMKIPYSEQEIIDAAIRLIKVNNVKECYIRPIAFFGYGSMALDTRECPVNVALIAWPWGALLGEESVEKGVSITVVPYRRQISGLSNAKIGGAYYMSICVKNYALSKGFDEGLMLDTDGYVAEGSGENIFMVKEGMFFTPKLGAVLPGITRAEVIKIIKENNWSIEEKHISVKEIKDADEVFFTGTAAEITPVVKIDKSHIKDGKVGEYTKKIRESFFSKI